MTESASQASTSSRRIRWAGRPSESLTLSARARNVSTRTQSGSGDGRGERLREIELHPLAARPVVGADPEQRAGRLGNRTVDGAGVVQAVPDVVGASRRAEIGERRLRLCEAVGTCAEQLS